MRIDNEDIVFESTGRRVYANCGIIGICEGSNGPGGVSTGYDDSLWVEDDLTPLERVELAEYMIGLWTRWLRRA